MTKAKQDHSAEDEQYTRNRSALIQDWLDIQERFDEPVIMEILVTPTNIIALNVRRPRDAHVILEEMGDDSPGNAHKLKPITYVG